MAEGAARPIEVFCSYADQDEILLQEFEKHLSNLQRKKHISIWHFRKMYVGMDREKQIASHLNAAHLILLLVSPNFMASNRCYTEMERAMERYEAGEAYVIPIILSPVSYIGAPFHKLEALPTGGEAVTTWLNQDSAFYQIAEQIEAVVERMHSQLTPKNNNKLVAAAKMQRTVQVFDAKNLYDVVLFYAPEDRFYAKTFADLLGHRGVKVFYYDQDMNTRMILDNWGKNRNTYLLDLYKEKAHYCALFLSQHYASKRGSKKLLKDLLNCKGSRYIFPIPLDGTEFPGILTDAIYLQWHEVTTEELADALTEKVKEVSRIVPY